MTALLTIAANRTGGSPASGSRTRPHAFTPDTSCRSTAQAYEPFAGAGHSLTKKSFGARRPPKVIWFRERRMPGEFPPHSALESDS